MEILITSKTHKGNAACVGGLVLGNNRLVRLLNPGNWDQYADTEFDIGDVWEISFHDRPDIVPPHIEDIIIESRRYVREIPDIAAYILGSGIRIYRGSPINIFNGLLGWTGNGNGYIGNRNNLPGSSVGFWVSDKDLIIDNDNKHFAYIADGGIFKFAYVGFVPKVSRIPAGTLMRISLARWWKPEDSDIAERCYLQLSGWYGLRETITHTITEDIDIDDLPF